MLARAESRYPLWLIRERPPVTARLGLAVAAVLAFALGLLGWSPRHWTLAAQSAKAPPQQGIVVVVNDEAITAYGIEQRARFLGLSTNVNDQAKASFEGLVK